MAADEARVARRGRAHGPLRRARIRDGAAGRRRLEHAAYGARKRSHRHGDERDLGIRERLLERGRGNDRAPLRGDVEGVRILIPSGNATEARPGGGEPDGGADQPGADDGKTHAVTRDRRRRPA